MAKTHTLPGNVCIARQHVCTPVGGRVAAAGFMHMHQWKRAVRSMSAHMHMGNALGGGCRQVCALAKQWGEAAGGCTSVGLSIELSNG